MPLSDSVDAVGAIASSSEVFSELGFATSFGAALGSAGIMGSVGTAGRIAFGVVSRWAESDGGCADDGVVGLVDSACSDAGRLVEGVSGRGIGVSACAGSSSTSVPATCWIFGSSTDSADNSVVTFFFRRGRLAGQGKSGLESQGSYLTSVKKSQGMGRSNLPEL